MNEKNKAEIAFATAMLATGQPFEVPKSLQFTVPTCKKVGKVGNNKKSFHNQKTRRKNKAASKQRRKK